MHIRLLLKFSKLKWTSGSNSTFESSDLSTSSMPLVETLGRSCANPCTSPDRWKDCYSWLRDRIQETTSYEEGAEERSLPHEASPSADQLSLLFHKLLQRVYIKTAMHLKFFQFQSRLYDLKTIYQLITALIF